MKKNQLIEKPSRRALIVIDVQNDYATGALQIEYPTLEHSLPNIGRTIDAAHRLGIPVVVVQTSTPAGSPGFAAGTEGWKLHEVVATRHWDHLIDKQYPSAFTSTDLADWLSERGIGIVTIVGYMTHNCDDSTIRHAVHLGLECEFISDASGAVSYANRAGTASAAEIHRVFCVVMQSRFAAVMTTDEWIAAVEAGARPERDTIFASAGRARRPVETRS